VQGASDSGLIPMFYPDYQRVNAPQARERFEKLWGTTLDPDPGLTVVEIMNAAKRHDIRGMYIMGENPAMSDPDVNHAREALAALDHLVVQDIFLTETAYLADVVLAATAWPEKTGTVTNTDSDGAARTQSDRGARRGEGRLLAAHGNRATRWSELDLQHPRDVFAEMRTCMDSIAGITWERLERESSVTYPCLKKGPGETGRLRRTFPTATGAASSFRPISFRRRAARRRISVVLITGRQLEHWHTGAMSRRAAALDALEPEPVASLHPLTSRSSASPPGGILTIDSRRGSISLYARADDGMPRGRRSCRSAYYEAAANVLTNPVLDPFGKIPNSSTAR
jgi:formate dehydrogenase major subunit